LLPAAFHGDPEQPGQCGEPALSHRLGLGAGDLANGDLDRQVGRLGAAALAEPTSLVVPVGAALKRPLASVDDWV
jgi:hypothetical protein